MERNKIILMLAIGTLFTPSLAIQAATVVPITKTTTTVKTENVVKTPVVLDKAKMEELKANLMKETETLRKNFSTQKIEIEKLIAEKKGEVKTRLAVQSQEKVRALLDTIFNKFNGKMSKLSNVDMKISAKIAILEKEGVNVTNVKAQYAIAKASLDKTTAEITAIRMVSLDQISAETSKGILRDLVKKAEDSMKATGAQYMKIIPMIESNNKVEAKTNIINKQ